MSWWCCNTASSSTADCFSSDARPLQGHKGKRIGICTYELISQWFPRLRNPDRTTRTSPKWKCLWFKVIGKVGPKAWSTQIRNLDLLPLPYVQLLRIWKKRMCVLVYYTMPCNHRLKKTSSVQDFLSPRCNPSWPFTPGIWISNVYLFSTRKRQYITTYIWLRGKAEMNHIPEGSSAHGLCVLFQDTSDWPRSSHCYGSYGNHKLIPTSSLHE